MNNYVVEYTGQPPSGETQQVKFRVFCEILYIVEIKKSNWLVL